MSEEKKPTDETLPPQADSAPAAEAKTEERLFTQSQVNEMIAKRLAKAERAQKGKDSEVTNKASTPEQTKETPSEVAELRAEIERIKARADKSDRDRAFADALSMLPDAARLNSRQRETLRNAFDPQHPEKLAVDAKELFGIGGETSPQTPAAAAKPQAPAGVPAGIAGQYQSPGAAAGQPGEIPSSPYEWTKDHISAMQRAGTFTKKLEEYRVRTEGGPDLFRRRVPGA